MDRLEKMTSEKNSKFAEINLVVSMCAQADEQAITNNNQAVSVSYTSDRIVEREICSDMSRCFQSSPRLLSRASILGSDPLNLTY